MANSKISALTSATTPLAGTEVLPIVQSGTTKKVAINDVTAGRDVTTKNLTATNAGDVTVSTNNTTTTGSSVLQTKNNLNNVSQIMFYGSAQAAYGALGSGESAWYSNAAAMTIMADNGSGVIKFATGGNAEKMRIASTGIVTMSAYGAGAATFSAAGVISSVSDETWKIKDGAPVDPDSMLKKLEPGYWYYNDKYKDTFGVDRQLGFYAQNVNAAIGPEAAPEPESTITTDENGGEVIQQKPWGYYDRSVLAVVVMALKNALKSIETLEEKISSLEAKIPA